MTCREEVIGKITEIAILLNEIFSPSSFFTLNSCSLTLFFYVVCHMMLCLVINNCTIGINFHPSVVFKYFLGFSFENDLNLNPWELQQAARLHRQLERKINKKFLSFVKLASSNLLYAVYLFIC